jgi:acyl-CoA thioester hydrolase
MRELLKEYPAVIEVPVAWGEMDALQHLNNTVYFRYFESVRMAYFTLIGFWRYTSDSGIGPILASTKCRFRIPLTYPDTVSVGARVPTIDEDRFLMQYIVVSHTHQKVAAEGEGMIVSFDYNEQKKTKLPTEIRQRIVALEAGFTVE